jgi:hypothetical protein
MMLVERTIARIGYAGEDSRLGLLLSRFAQRCRRPRIEAAAVIGARLREGCEQRRALVRRRLRRDSRRPVYRRILRKIKGIHPIGGFSNGHVRTRMTPLASLRRNLMLQWKHPRLVAVLVLLTALAASFGSWGWDSIVSWS